MLLKLSSTISADVSHTQLPTHIRIGGMDKPQLLAALRGHNVQLNQSAEALFDNPRFSPTSKSADGRETMLEIAAVSVAELGFAEGATYEQIIRTAREKGLAEAPLELGPHLRLQYPDQPEGSIGFPPTQHCAPPGSITIASPPLDDRDETPKGFYLRRIDGTLWLRGYRSWPGHIWSPQDILVFMRPAH